LGGMKLTGYGGKSKRVGAAGAFGASGVLKARTTLPGFENLHGQTVVRAFSLLLGIPKR
jgi:hypothetical protein